MTPEARTEVAALITDWLSGGSIRVSDDHGQTASAPVEVAPGDGAEILLTAVFDELTANFHWTRRDVLNAGGTLVDTSEEDYGEKTLGHVWTIEVPLEVAA